MRKCKIDFEITVFEITADYLNSTITFSASFILKLK